MASAPPDNEGPTSEGPFRMAAKGRMKKTEERRGKNNNNTIKGKMAKTAGCPQNKIRAADAKEVGVGNPAEETCCYPNKFNVAKK